MTTINITPEDALHIEDFILSNLNQKPQYGLYVNGKLTRAGEKMCIYQSAKACKQAIIEQFRTKLLTGYLNDNPKQDAELKRIVENCKTQADNSPTVFTDTESGLSSWSINLLLSTKIVEELFSKGIFEIKLVS